MNEEETRHKQIRGYHKNVLHTVFILWLGKLGRVLEILKYSFAHTRNYSYSKLKNST